MKSKTFWLDDRSRIINISNYLQGVPCDGTLEVVVRNRQENKTIHQLGAIHGFWFDREKLK